ncbi:MAG: metal ABC transporter solute-binding protein, Zn/Mn family [Phocaeicola sp.]|uniref:metal ABC transporter solute-binding protein, Zn/Mn family n=1 Tax=Phocaeicola sp. TaxID=2773926 RepID=UPI003FA02D70
MRKILCYICLIIGFSACGNNPTNKERIITVTIEPLRYFTEAIAGGQYKIVNMVPEGTSPETYDPTPQQLIDLSKSAAYFKIGYIGFEQHWMDRLKENNPQLNIFDTSEGVRIMKSNDEHSIAGVEPHIWNSTQNATVIAQNICKALCKLDAKHTDDYTHRLDSLQHIIHKTDSIIKTDLQQADTAFIIFHPALSYFARDYGLKQICMEENGKEPSPASLQQIIKEGKANRVHTIFIQKEFDSRNTQLIADEMGLKVITINPLSYHWQEEMIRVADALKQK